MVSSLGRGRRRVPGRAAHRRACYCHRRCYQPRGTHAAAPPHARAEHTPLPGQLRPDAALLPPGAACFTCVVWARGPARRCRPRDAQIFSTRLAISDAHPTHQSQALATQRASRGQQCTSRERSPGLLLGCVPFPTVSTQVLPHTLPRGVPVAGRLGACTCVATMGGVCVWGPPPRPSAHPPTPCASSECPLDGVGPLLQCGMGRIGGS